MGDLKCREVKTAFCRKGQMQTGSFGTLIGWKSGKTTYVPLWDWMEGAWLWTLYVMKKGGEGASILMKQWTSSRKHCFEFYWYNRTSAESISRVPKNSRFPGPNPLPLAHVMYLPASKTLRRGRINVHMWFYEPERPFMHLTDCCWFLISSGCVSVMGGGLAMR